MARQLRTVSLARLSKYVGKIEQLTIREAAYDLLGEVDWNVLVQNTILCPHDRKIGTTCKPLSSFCMQQIVMQQ
ncbi:MAG: hypothetical protein OXF73_06445 [Gammaproteobacteria bacterium]|nr:hypothetical protein [Gammaproteobacteria bacterium]